jgi:hypothetical protein
VTRSLSETPVSAPLLDVGDAGGDAVPPVRVPVAGAAVTEVRGARASCSACDWVATMRGDTDEELADFLRQRFAAHVAEKHRRTP